MSVEQRGVPFFRVLKKASRNEGMQSQIPTKWRHKSYCLAWEEQTDGHWKKVVCGGESDLPVQSRKWLAGHISDTQKVLLHIEGKEKLLMYVR